jgi:hypothetical protein
MYDNAFSAKCNNAYFVCFGQPLGFILLVKGLDQSNPSLSQGKLNSGDLPCFTKFNEV